MVATFRGGGGVTEKDLRTISIDIPDALARRVAHYIRQEGGLGPLVGKALEEWVAREEARSRQRWEAVGAVQAATAPDEVA